MALSSLGMALAVSLVALSQDGMIHHMGTVQRMDTTLCLVNGHAILGNGHLLLFLCTIASGQHLIGMRCSGTNWWFARMQRREKSALPKFRGMGLQSDLRTLYCRTP